MVRRVTASSYQMEELRRWTQAATAVPTMRSSTTKGSAKCARVAVFVLSEAGSLRPDGRELYCGQLQPWQFAFGFGGGVGSRRLAWPSPGSIPAGFSICGSPCPRLQETSKRAMFCCWGCVFLAVRALQFW